MNSFITLLRLPFGILAIIVVSFLYLILFPYELIILIVALPIGAIFMDRCEIKNSWIGTFPNSLKAIKNKAEDIWEWVAGDGYC